MISKYAIAALAIVAACDRPLRPEGNEPSNGEKPNGFFVVGSETWEFVEFFVDFANRTTGQHVAASYRASTHSPGDSVHVTATISGPPKGTAFQYLTSGAFDTAGNLWISAGSSSLQGSVIEYTVAQQKLGGALAPAVAIGGLQAPEGLAFDHAGNLWVVDYETDRLSEYTASQIAASGSPAPAVSISLAGVTFAGATYHPRGLALDKAGNAWISFIIDLATRPPVSIDSVPNEMVAEYSATTIATSGTPSPAVMLRPTGAALNSYAGGYGVGLALDSAGNLWTSNLSQTVTEFAAASLTPGANPAPVVGLRGNWASAGGLVGIGFDASGALMVATGESLMVYVPSDIAQSGTPTPDITYPSPSQNPIVSILGSRTP